ncbi:DNA internalization-related competence protein ComEC/Rec2 [Vibrio sp. SCSIO 43135]|uniref:DNA internalization-related competence protein ComEC/Rec2 n=1 Tax=Vibrio sp. SCSIO 43135 TaxID=2819096 RepID=UPI0033656E8D
MTLFSNYWLLASFFITIITASHWPVMPSLAWLLPVIGFSLLSMKYRRLRVVLGSSLALFVIVINGNLISLQTNTLFHAGQNITINAKVDSFFKQISRGYEATVVVRSINGQTLPALVRPRIRLHSNLPIHLGDEITASVYLKRIYGQMNEAGFDKEQYYISQGWLARGVIDHHEPLRIRSASSLRSALHSKVAALLEENEQLGPILALSFGDRSRLTLEQRERYRTSGLSHLIAISGLHIGLAFAIGFFVGRVLTVFHYNLVWASLVTGFLFAVCYSWLAGFSVPTTRALVMCVIVVGLLAMNLRSTLLMKILLTAVVLTFVSPFSVLSSSFWLSLTAVSVLYWVTAHTPVTWGLVRKTITIQIAITLLLTPLSSYLFSGLSLSSVAYNLFFIPWFSFVVVPVLFVSLAATLIGASWCQPLWELVAASLDLVSWASEHSINSWIVLSDLQWLGITCLTLVLSVGTVLRRKAQILTAAVMGSIFVSVVIKQTSDGRLRIDVLDVGHGLAVLVQRNGQATLYDTGIGWEGGSMVRSTVAPLLHARGVERLDGVVYSHMDNDHAGGAEDVKQLLSPTKVWSSQSLAGANSCVKGESWNWQGVDFHVLWPPDTVSRAYNPHSCVIKLVDVESQFSLLLTGDMDAVVEWLLVRNPSILDSEVVIVPHHGSRTSSTSAFVASVSPSLAIASTAKHGRWDLPNRHVVERYQRYGSEWLDTGTHGQITLHVGHQGWQVSHLRQNEGGAWYRQMLRNGVE